MGTEDGAATRGGNEATDKELPYDPRVTGHRSQLEPVLNVALSSPLGAIECFIGWFHRSLGSLGHTSG